MRGWAKWLFVMALCLPGGVALGQGKTLDDESEMGAGAEKYPIGQYAVALIFIGASMWSLRRSSRRGWN